MNNSKHNTTHKKNPFIVALSMVKNEEDIIEAFIRHNSRFIDIFCILDNGSFDQTRFILQSLIKEGFKIIIIDDFEKAYIQNEKMTRFCHHTMITLFPDYIIFLDADEFIRCNRRAEFEKEIEKIPIHGKGFLEWQSYIMNDENVEIDSSLHNIALINRLKDEYQVYNKVILRTNGDYIPELILAQGNHDIFGIEKSAKLCVKLAHYPVRSLNQLKEKCIAGWMAYLLKSPKARYENLGFHWMNIFDEIKNGSDINIQRAIEISANYSTDYHDNWKDDVITDPIKFNFTELLYTQRKTKNILSKIATLIEENLEIRKDMFLENLSIKLAYLKEKTNNFNYKKDDGAQIFDDSWHIDNFYFDIPPIKYLVDKIQPNSVLDIGCGIGQYLSYFKYTSANEIIGIDGISEKATLLEPFEFISQNLEYNFDLKRTFDLVICLETLEHLDEKVALGILENISKHAKKYILFSAGEPNQPGLNHINCQSIEYWLDKWGNLGWQVDEFDSISMRLLSTFLWFKRNILVLVKSDDNDVVGQPLIDYISSKTIKWWNQPPSIVQSTLQYEFCIPNYSGVNIKNSNLSSDKKTSPNQIKNVDIKLVDSIRLSTIKKTKNLKIISQSDNYISFIATENDPIIILPKLNIENKRKLILQIDLLSPSNTIAQIFYKQKKIRKKFSEENSISHQIIKGENTIQFELPFFFQNVDVRFDPGACSGEFIVRKIEIWQSM